MSHDGNPNFGRKGKMSKGRNVKEIDFSSHRFLVNDLNNNLFIIIQRYDGKWPKGKMSKTKIIQM